MAFDRSLPVLVVDDFRQMVRIVAAMMRDLGFTDIDTAQDGSSALRKLRQRSFALVICDWKMEPMSGYQLLKEVRADPDLVDLPFIMMSGESKGEYVVMAREAGVSNYIIKPFTTQVLGKRIEATVGSFLPIETV